jgi:hypothetical protein
LRSKNIAIALLAALSFLSPFLEAMLTGGIEALGEWEIAATLAALVLVFWWYHVDKAERGYRAGPLMNGGMLLVMVIALPVYLLRSRGWKRGAVAAAIALAVLGALFALEAAGEWLGMKLRF